MNIGTKSLLFGVHQFLIHPLMIAIGWYKLFGFSKQLIVNTSDSKAQYTSLYDPRLWLCFIVHDWGYWGCKEVDGPDGKHHPHFGAAIVGKLTGSIDWYHFCIHHSRTTCAEDGVEPSLLCYADKMVSFIEPYWLYAARAWLSGERQEILFYLGTARTDHIQAPDFKSWYYQYGLMMKSWVERSVEK